MFFAGVNNSRLFKAQVNRRLGQVENYPPPRGVGGGRVGRGVPVSPGLINPALSLHRGGARGIRDPRWMYCMIIKLIFKHI